MPHATGPLLIQLAAFMVAILPLLIGNLRSLKVGNTENLLLFSLGLAFTMMASEQGWSDRSATAIMVWVVGGTCCLLVAAVLGLIPGGIAKTLGALVPWFPPMQYLTVWLLGAGLMVGLALARRRSVGIVAPLVLSGIVVMLGSLPLSR